MQRYYGNDSEYDEDERENIDTDAIVEATLDAVRMDLAEANLSQSLLDKAIEIAKSDWLWNFRRASKKTKIIEKIYRRLSMLMIEEM